MLVAKPILKCSFSSLHGFVTAAGYNNSFVGITSKSYSGGGFE